MVFDRQNVTEGMVAAELLLREPEAARLLAVTPRALQAWRRTGTGPQYVRISGRCIRYRLGDIKAWATARVCRSTSES